MTCDVVQLENGTRAIVCSGIRRQRCVGCGGSANLLCDWKVPSRKSGTCDAAICATCTHAPAPDKDLCPPHAAAWRERCQAGEQAA